jgi:anti-sigma factor RsiW
MTTPFRGPSAHEEFGEPAMSRAALLRAAADNELSAADASTLCQHLAEFPEDAARIEFERDLRVACNRAMSSEDVTVPSGLRDRMATMLATSTQHEPATRADQKPRHRRVRAGWLAGVVAVIVVFGLGVLVANLLPSPTFSESPQRARIALAGFLGTEHRRCSLDDRAIKRKMTEYNLGQAPAKFKTLLGAELSVANVEKAGYTFLGAGSCIVPGSGASVHLVFSDVSAAPATLTKGLTCDPTRLSLFIQKDTGELPISPETTYRLEMGDGNPLVVVWLRDGLIYYLVTETKTAEDAVLDHLALAEASRAL